MFTQSFELLVSLLVFHLLKLHCLCMFIFSVALKGTYLTEESRPILLRSVVLPNLSDECTSKHNLMIWSDASQVIVFCDLHS